MYNKRLLFLPAQLTGSLFAIAGGGGGGQIIGGGGGAGGYYSGSATFTTQVSYSIEIGGGGVGSIGYSNTPDTTNGSDTIISVLEVPTFMQHVTGSVSGFYSSSFYTSMSLHGGGLGTGWSDTRSAKNYPGGSGGGGSCNGTNYFGGDIIHPIQGHVGGKASTHPDLNYGDGGGGGGGGAGGPGDDAPSLAVGGHGGIGISTDISGVTRNFGGGGGGGTRASTGNNYSNNGVAGGLYGGGRGGYNSSIVNSTGGATDAVVNSGGGGGCGGYDNGVSHRQGGNGGSGIVLLSVLSGSIASTTGSPNILISGSQSILEFLSSGTVVFKSP